MTQLQRLIVGCPFGNYLHEWPHTTPTLGTYTRKRRGGFWKRLWRVARTVRYYPGIQAWKNRLGLPNPGLFDLIYRAYSSDLRARINRSIVSVMGHQTDDWSLLVGQVTDLQPLAIEINTSCPNCPGEDQSDYSRAFKLAVNCVPYVPRLIVKLPPVGYAGLIAAALDAGINAFHCCNTLPTPGGGLSGKPLQALSLQAIEEARRLLKHAGMSSKALIIGGGGVTHEADARRFLNAGATNVSVASVLFNPLNWSRIRKMAEALKVPT